MDFEDDPQQYFARSIHDIHVVSLDEDRNLSFGLASLQQDSLSFRPGHMFRRHRVGGIRMTDNARL